MKKQSTNTLKRKNNFISVYSVVPKLHVEIEMQKMVKRSKVDKEAIYSYLSRRHDAASGRTHHR